MGYSNHFFDAIGVRSGRGGNISEFSKKTGIPAARLKFYNANNVLPSGRDLKLILKASKITELVLKLKMGRIDKDVINALSNSAEDVASIIQDYEPEIESPQIACEKGFETKLGKLYRGDCYELLRSMKSDSVDLVFADPPFNLSKLYPSEIDDNLKTEKYLHWCEEWIYECVRVLKDGGAFFLWNLPKWNSILSQYLDSYLTFRHWVSVDIKYSLPIQGRLYPAHYSLLYYVKGEKPNTFTPDRIPLQTCPKCYEDIKDYGGYKHKMNPLGINLSDIWSDIPPVRHAKYKRREGANELSLKLMDRILEISTKKGDLVFDPFGGSGTTYMAAELKQRKWVGCEIGPLDTIIQRFEMIDEESDILKKYRGKINALFPEDIREERIKRGIWTAESIRKKKNLS